MTQETKASTYAFQTVAIDLDKEISPAKKKKVITTVDETPFEVTNERVKVESMQRGERESSEEVRVREEVKKVDGNTMRTIITQKIINDVEAIKEPPKVMHGQSKRRETRSERKMKLSAMGGSHGGRHSPESSEFATLNIKQLDTAQSALHYFYFEKFFPIR